MSTEVIRPILLYAGLLESFFSKKILFHSRLLSLSTIDQEAEVSRMVWTPAKIFVGVQ